MTPPDFPPPAVQELVVTATRLPTPISQAPGAYVMTADDIQRRQATFAFDVLADIPGVQLSRAGAFGGVTSVQIRGASSDKTLVLVDGAAMNDPTAPAGGFDFSSLDLEGVDRIEVLEGPQASLWGSDAIGGVVSITTREPAGLSAAGEAGSFGTVRASASAGIADAGRAAGVSVGWFRAGGISAADARDGNGERDGMHSLTAQAGGRLSLADGVSLDGRVRYGRAHAALDSFGGPTGVIDGPDTQDQTTWSGFVRARFKGPLGFSQQLRVDGMDMDRLDEVFFGGLFPFEARGRRIDYRWTAERSGQGPSAVTLGIERQDAREDTGDGAQTYRNWAGFGVWRFTPSDRLTTTVSVRRDAPRGYAGVTTARGSAVLGLGGGITLSGSAGQGFKAPSIFQTSYPCFECSPPGRAVGLKPERAVGWDANLGWRSADGRAGVKATVYRLSERDEITYAPPRGYVNIARARTTGVEVEGDMALGRWLSARASYGFADAKDVSTGMPLLRTPMSSGSASLAWRGRRAEAELTVRAQGAASDVYGTIRPFAVAGLTGSYEVAPRVRITGRIENLTNAHYQEAFGFGEPGFGAFVGVRLAE